MTNMVGNRVCFASWMRTGNTMTRKYIEAITGVHTGSDMPLIITNVMQSWGMAGEDHVCDDGSVWITKTHWPMPDPYKPFYETIFTMDRCFVITRNFIDVLPSMFLLFHTGSHSQVC